MTLQLSGTTIERVLIVDDDQSVRSSYEDPVIDCDLEPEPESGPIRSKEEYVSRMVMNGVQAAICDHHLKKRDYSVVDGAELIAEFYRNQFPALLCTRWRDAQPEEIRKYRRYIPVLLSPDELDPDSIYRGLEMCIQEFQGNLLDSRRPWRSMVRLEDFDPNGGAQQRLYIVVPSWNPNRVLALLAENIPIDILKTFIAGTNRVFADINLGADLESELYFDNWRTA